MLETEIKNLTAAIQLLTDAVNKNQSIIQPKAEAPVAEALAEPPVFIGHQIVEVLQGRCLELTRIDRANSPKIKAIIASYGAAVLKDVPADKLVELSVKLEELV